MTLREVLQSGRWFRRSSWDGTFEPFFFRFMNGKLERAPSKDLFNAKYSERRFGPFDVLANDWEFVDEPRTGNSRRTQR